jgi:crossover junction endodeoxyribonuclease RuvC
MIIAGVDPGLASTGYGVIEHNQGHSRPVEFGTIKTSATQPLAQRLQTIHGALVEVFRRCNPSVVAVEELFFANNALSAMGVAQARGVAVLAACQPGITVVEYTPLEIKLAVTGSGRADKTQVHRMVEILLGLKAASNGPKQPLRMATAHESDALAAALCHAQSGKLAEIARDMSLGTASRLIPHGGAPRRARRSR